MSIISFLIKVVFIQSTLYFLNLLKKFLIFTGFWIPTFVAFGFLAIITFSNSLGWNADNPIFNTIIVICLSVSFIPALYIFCQNVIHIVKNKNINCDNKQKER